MAANNGWSSRRPMKGGNFTEADRMLEEENDRQIAGLAGKVSQLKSLTVDIEGEARNHNHYLDDMQGDFEGTTTLLGGSNKRLKSMVSSASQNPRFMCYLILFIVVIFFIAYYMVGRAIAT
ncbi:uncharacterized protein TRIADDRAFT_51677 [Trichoplax adhaerens]|uniref:t-SNARE coiled-coil homology domain-containing protein n=1 Tax=Trichoplax adhaerens TaxID=10228 RepID=B3RKH0_TRIAD|nr:hypothetical protein TRIADDRAFT_51677 [Trichoplax adhaerens]EDV28598.1 hypothetical protein TRIADDRAFT_51677 [Trichoplax adhaerens]|eukprot:XP_002107800.1 hypothetical protein TRIADDRAFT_51677 [Trichoplax adhaerens]